MSDPDGATDGSTGAERDGVRRARDALAAAKSDARHRGARPGVASRGAQGAGPARRARNDDPEPISDLLGRLLSDQGWQERAAMGGVFGRWEQIVGSELAEHTRPESFADGEVVVLADSAAWATQVRLLATTLVRRLNEELGHGSVTRVKVTGPGSGERRRRGTPS